MTKYVYEFTEGGKQMKGLLGGKGANLAEMSNLGLPVPPGFIISTEACVAYLRNGTEPAELAEQIDNHLRALEQARGKFLGDADDPLLVSVRSGAKFSMPGMMETVLNVGLNDTSVAGLARQSGDERFAWDSYRRLLQMFGKIVLGVDGDAFEAAIDDAKRERGVRHDVELDPDALRNLVGTFEQVIRDESGYEFPQDPAEQLRQAIRAVFDSWNTPRAAAYRRQERIPADLGTAVNVVVMVFGNLGDDSGTGVAFTRDPSTGEQGVYGDFLPNAQGEDVVAGIRNTVPLAELERLDKPSYDQLLDVMTKLERHYRDLCDIEFTIERGTLWMLQTRVGKRTAAAAFRLATQLVDEGLIDMDEALRRVDGSRLAQLMFPTFDPNADKKRAASGMNASPGAAVGRAVFASETAVEWSQAGEDVILVRRETNPDDLDGMIAARGILTSRGGRTSHAAVVARGMGKPAVCGAEEVDVDPPRRRFAAGGALVSEGDVISIDGSSGEIFLDEVPVVHSPVMQFLQEGRTDTTDERSVNLVSAVDRLMRAADDRRRMRVRANADLPEDASQARRLGAEGIGLCRTEHMFLGERRAYVERMILADSDDERSQALDALRPLQTEDFRQLLEAMDGLPLTIRLLDPPLHEFLPDITDLAVRVAMAEERGEKHENDLRLLQAVRKLHEQNPMLGLRGVRLGLVIPGLFVMQVRAITEAMVNRLEAGGDPQPEVMIPLVGAVQEFELVEEEVRTAVNEIVERSGYRLEIPIGTMIELPRAALTAGRIARVAEFFSFGTNDLTQTTWGFSRDDVEAAFFSAYLEKGIFGVSPFESLDVEGTGRLVRIAVEEGRAARSDLKLGICGEHGGDPESVRYCHDMGMDYVSCSAFRIPVARLEAGRAAIGI